ncbi:hypothetical protein AVEN_131765-1 [Araneus ventricosus]|uniref:Uncharacterized protein n=1 Tax=Araneus ventricosus TaxID=182803 RepID=A0A4Y2CV38_ARAVE|nr:hypothetical protein AVEN_131765-1 [Araneus ventricosus]
MSNKAKRIHICYFSPQRKCGEYIFPNVIEGRDSSLCVVLLKNPFNFRNHFLLGYVPQHRTLKLQDTRQDREQHHDTSTQTRMTERHHGKKMAPVAPPTIERRRQFIVTATMSIKWLDERDGYRWRQLKQF